MSEEKQPDNDPERTLLTLDQLSQTIEVMTNVVNRLRQHLSEQLRAQAETAKLARELAEQSVASDAEEDQRKAKEQQAAGKAGTNKKGAKDSFVVEIKQQDSDPDRKNSKTLH